MSKDAKNQNPNTDRAEKDCFEMIELAVNDMEVLTRAFDIIKDVCDQISEVEVEDDQSEYILN